jgi:hypothetical protein
LGFSFPKNQLLSPYLRKKEGWKMLESKEIENVIFLIIDALGYHEFLKHSKLLKKIFLTNGTVLSSIFHPSFFRRYGDKSWFLGKEKPNKDNAVGVVFAIFLSKSG